MGVQVVIVRKRSFTPSQLRTRLHKITSIMWTRTKTLFAWSKVTEYRSENSLVNRHQRPIAAQSSTRKKKIRKRRKKRKRRKFLLRKMVVLVRRNRRPRKAGKVLVRLSRKSRNYPRSAGTQLCSRAWMTWKAKGAFNSWSNKHMPMNLWPSRSRTKTVAAPKMQALKSIL